MRAYTLSKRQTQALLEELDEAWPPGSVSEETRNIRIVELDDKTNFFITDEWIAVRHQGAIFPLLKSEKVVDKLQEVVVDTGAVPHICNGANVMRPGVVGYSPNLKKGRLVAVREERHRKCIAVGTALVDAGALESMKGGAIVETLHFVGDRIWEAYKAMPKV